MATLVVSDLHLGASSGADLLRRPELRAPLIAALRDGIRRLVILGDGLELREVPVRNAAAHAEALLAEAGAALGPGGEIVLLAGNHDHGLLAGWLETRLHQGPHELGLEQAVEPAEAGPLAEALAAAAAPAALRLSYPGIWLREDVYALHGHYLDVHTTVPTFERLAAGAMERWVAPVRAHATPDDYEAVLAPLYAWMHALAQRSADGVVRAGARSSARAWVAVAGEGRRRRPLRAAALGAGFKVAVRAINAAGVGPVRPELSGPALRQGSLHGIGEVVRRLDVGAAHVIFGHTHRSGPWPGDAAAEWEAPTGARLVNAGCWVYQPHFVATAGSASPYWPGTAVRLDDDGSPPRLLRLLGDRRPEDLAPARAARG
ncbi:MAG TPA: hypothetical protein VM266_06985 [Solirubrobacteraceae bacterium]|nr:hypothetical protein [Solirubrobacteraceae bacterium]